jgi:hypothetical protein
MNNFSNLFALTKNHIMKTLKYILPAIAFLCISVGVFAQTDKSTRPSPPATAMNKVGNLEIKIDYSQPAVKDRTIWGELVPYDQVWRTGANEATTISFSEDVMIAGNAVKAGTYALFTIPGKNEWTVILNSESNQWGAYKYNKEKDVMRINVKPQRVESKSERLQFNISQNGEVSMHWDKLKFGFAVSAKNATMQR